MPTIALRSGMQGCAFRFDVPAIEAACRELGVTMDVDLIVERTGGNYQTTYGTHRVRSRGIGRPMYHRIMVARQLTAERASKTLWHELTHAAQAERIDNPQRFYRDHYKLEGGAGSYGPAYQRNRFEVEARQVADEHEADRLTFDPVSQSMKSTTTAVRQPQKGSTMTTTATPAAPEAPAVHIVDSEKVGDTRYSFDTDGQVWAPDGDKRTGQVVGQLAKDDKGMWTVTGRGPLDGRVNRDRSRKQALTRMLGGIADPVKQQAPKPAAPVTSREATPDELAKPEEPQQEPTVRTVDVIRLELQATRATRRDASGSRKAVLTRKIKQLEAELAAAGVEA